MRRDTFPDLRAFLVRLRADGDLAEIDAPVDPYLEVPEIHRRVIAEGGPALLFRNPVRDPELRRRAAPVGHEGVLPVADAGFTGPYETPLVTNLFGTARRVELAFGERPQRLIRRLVELAETALPPRLGTLWGARDLAGELLRVGFRKSRRAPVTEMMTTDVRLDRLPITTSWQGDGGPFLTLPLVHTESPSGKGPNLGMYRLHVHDERRTGMHWQIGKGGGFHYAEAEARGEALPATVFLGGPPALILAAIAPLPENVPELMLASLIAGERLERTAGPGPHPLLARAEMALVGRVAPYQRLPEGPFGDHYGYYSLRHDYPVFEIETLCRRHDAILPATVVGKPKQEDFFIGDLLQELLSPLFPLVMPAVRDLWSYGETGYHSLAAAVVRERYRREAMTCAFRILGEGQLALTKFLLVTDRPVDLRDFPATLAHVLERTEPESDLFVFGNLAMDTLDYTGPRVNEGSKGVWLGLGDPVRELPRGFSASDLPPGIDKVEVFCPGCLVIGGEGWRRVEPRPEGLVYEAREEERRDLAELASHPAFAHWPLLVLVDDPAATAASPAVFLWTAFTRFEPAADIHAAATRVVRNQVVRTAPVLVDARLHPGFPQELRVHPEVAGQVKKRWPDLLG